MELLSAARVLARRRVLVLLGALAAIAVGLAAMGVLPAGPAVSGARTTGMARTRVLVDTPHSLIGDLRARADTVGAQAALLSDLLATDEQARVIARGAGVAAGALAVLRPAMTMPTKVSPLGEDASVAASAPAPCTLTLRTSTSLPIVTIDAVAPDRRVAARLAGAAASALRSVAAARAPSPDRALDVTSLEPVRSVTVVSGGGRRVPIAVAGTIVAFALWCGTIVVAAGLARAWRTLSLPPARARG